MKKGFSRAVFAVGALSLPMLAALAQAQEGGPPSRGAAVTSKPATGGADDSIINLFGTLSEDIYVLSWTDFFPSSGLTYSSNTLLGLRWTTNAGNSFMTAGLDGIDNGALLTQIVFYCRDNDATNNFEGFLAMYSRESNAGGSPTGVTLFGFGPTAGTPGDTVVLGNISYTLRRRVPGGTPTVNNFVLFAHTPGETGNVAVSQVRIVWRRQISPAPANATFLDVPTSHAFFQFIEALAASGVTAGCGGGNYCPNDPVTRGQLAVFLARLVGLHWPAF